MASPIMSTVAPTIAENMSRPQPPIVYVVQLLAQVFVATFSAFSFIPRLFVPALQVLLFVLTAAVAPIRYILSPILVFTGIVLDISILMPIRGFIYFANAFYPVYVLAGTAILTAALIGLLGRYASSFIVTFIFGYDREKEPNDAFSAQNVAPRRSEKKVTIREEKRALRGQ